MSITTLQRPAEAKFAAPNFLPTAYFRNQFVPFDQAQISIATHALHYGTAVLGGIRGFIIDGEALIFRLEAHCQRLSNSAKFMGYHLSRDALQATLIEFVQRNQPATAFYLRPLIYTSGLGVAPRFHQVEKDLLIYGVPMGDYLARNGVRCRISSWARQEDRSQPLRGKTTAAYIASALAKTEAVESGFDEAILMNSQGKVSEASAMNLFLVRNGQLITPSFDQDILEGITRDSILTIAENLDIPVIERPVDKSELFIADEIFLSGTAAQITPVLSIENYDLPSMQPITHQLRESLQSIMLGKEPHYNSWLTRVNV
ncbi:branched-chain amino acid transaminase [Leptolyngbyaceae cyanobacterium CCMR0082]|uniref:Branched-chain-amino-acid aminotransferase n=1 Tax=Adonisia turfae CCMR0082 TaxID=2304604 RepID=A0A6M0S5P6_9CYAN|nr:branched-chain amino acid transaminase [Adonisia turfae]NEZ63725.1 branched-chain amino acid transaminase [Adonisia turfae CCMR0082]